MGEWIFPPRILSLCARWRWVISFTLQPLYPRSKRSRYPFDRKLVESQSRSGCEGKENHCLCRESNRNSL